MTKPRNSIEDYELFEHLRSEGLTYSELAEVFDVSIRTVGRTVKKLGLIHNTIDEVELLFYEGYDANQISKELKVTLNCVYKNIKKLKLSLKPWIELNNTSKFNELKALRLYINTNTDREIAKKLGDIKENRVVRWREKYNLPPNYGNKAARRMFNRTFTDDKESLFYGEGADIAIACLIKPIEPRKNE